VTVNFLSEKDIFEKIIEDLPFDINEYLSSELSETQSKIIEGATEILKDNIVGNIVKLGGNIQENKGKFDDFIKKIESELVKEDYKNVVKVLKQILKEYTKKLQEMIVKSCVAIIPVKEMPWVDVLFRSIPRISIGDNNKVSLLENIVAYYGEIKCIIPRTTIFGKIKNQKPLFAPFIGDLDLKGYKTDQSHKDQPQSRFNLYVSAIIDSLDSSSTRNQLAKYHEGYQRHGEPICDFLMNKKDLLEIMDRIRSGLESGRIKSDISVCGIALPLPSDKTSFVLCIDEGGDSKTYLNCFEGFLRFSAACCEAVLTMKDTKVEPSAQEISAAPSALRSPEGQELKVWTEEELTEEARKRGSEIPSNIDVWTEKELKKSSEERVRGIPEGMEVWTEEELLELSKKREGGLNIPAWIPDNDLVECPKCSYSLRKSWSECPICGTVIESKEKSETKPSTKENSDEKKSDEKQTE
jgi:rubrerythrin/uncharacterized protein YjgD (DUF1641 family)